MMAWHRVVDAVIKREVRNHVPTQAQHGQTWKHSVSDRSQTQVDNTGRSHVGTSTRLITETGSRAHQGGAGQRENEELVLNS